MASFDSLARWEKYVPTLGNNHELSQPFYLRVAAGLTIEELRGLRERVDALTAGATAAQTSAVFAGVVQMGGEPLVVDGAPVDTLEKYLELVAHQRGGDLLGELLSTLFHLNSTAGAQELFSARLSGGSRTTRPSAPETADTRSGSSTSPSRGPTPPRATRASGGLVPSSTPAASGSPGSLGESTQPTP